MFFNPYRERFGAVHIVTDDDPDGQTYTHAIDVPKHLRAEAATIKIDAAAASVLDEAPDMGETAFDYIKRRTADSYRQSSAAAQS
jgi:hypothetical protein